MSWNAVRASIGFLCCLRWLVLSVAETFFTTNWIYKAFWRSWRLYLSSSGGIMRSASELLIVWSRSRCTRRARSARLLIRNTGKRFYLMQVDFHLGHWIIPRTISIYSIYNVVSWMVSWILLVVLLDVIQLFVWRLFSNLCFSLSLNCAEVHGVHKAP